MSIKFTLKDLQLPLEWIQLFRIILSIYLFWLILLTPRKPLFNDNLTSRILFGILLFLFAQTDFLSGLLLIMIYFFSFQSVLPIVWEGFEDEEKESITTTPTPTQSLEDKLDQNLKRPSKIFPEETPSPPIKFNMSYGTDKALKLNEYDD